MFENIDSSFLLILCVGVIGYFTYLFVHLCEIVSSINDKLSKLINANEDQIK